MCGATLKHARFPHELAVPSFGSRLRCTSRMRPTILNYVPLRFTAFLAGSILLVFCGPDSQHKFCEGENESDKARHSQL
jgi:hypothetical protein